MFSMSVHTIILTLSPVVSIALSLFLFGTFPGPQELLGGVLVLIGVVIVTRG
jgi:drug/metabolite transporter (DMT)-like permease